MRIKWDVNCKIFWQGGCCYELGCWWWVENHKTVSTTPHECVRLASDGGMPVNTHDLLSCKPVQVIPLSSFTCRKCVLMGVGKTGARCSELPRWKSHIGRSGRISLWFCVLQWQSILRPMYKIGQGIRSIYLRTQACFKWRSGRAVDFCLQGVSHTAAHSVSERHVTPLLWAEVKDDPRVCAATAACKITQWTLVKSHISKRKLDSFCLFRIGFGM